MDRCSVSPSRPTINRRVEFVPQSMAATGPASWPRSCIAVHRPTGSSPPARCHARWAWRHLTPSRVPPTPPEGLGPSWSTGIVASRSLAYRACVAASSAGPTSASARFTPPADSSLPTSSRSCRPTNQYRVGIGVPSNNNGALRMTTGTASVSRTTTEKAPATDLPKSCSTALMSSGEASSSLGAAPRSADVDVEMVDPVGAISTSSTSSARVDKSDANDPSSGTSDHTPASRRSIGARLPDLVAIEIGSLRSSSSAFHTSTSASIVSSSAEPIVATTTASWPARAHQSSAAWSAVASLRPCSSNKTVTSSGNLTAATCARTTTTTSSKPASNAAAETSASRTASCDARRDFTRGDWVCAPLPKRSSTAATDTSPRYRARGCFEIPRALRERRGLVSFSTMSGRRIARSTAPATVHFAAFASTVTLLLGLALVTLPTASLGATTTGLSAQAAAIAAKVAKDNATLATIGANYLNAVAAHQRELVVLSTTRSQLTNVRAEIAREQHLLQRAAVQAYVGEGSNSPLTLFLSGEPSRITTTNAYLGIATRIVSSAVVTLGNARIALAGDLVIEDRSVD